MFTKKAKRELVTHEKFYYFDSGVYRAIRPTGPLDQPQEIDGAALETLVIQQLRAWASYREEGEKLYFWRSRGGTEVDVVIYGKRGLWAIEIKNSGKVRPEDLAGLREFGQDYPMSERILLYRGKHREVVSGVTLHTRRRISAAAVTGKRFNGSRVGWINQERLLDTQKLLPKGGFCNVSYSANSRNFWCSATKS